MDLSFLHVRPFCIFGKSMNAVMSEGKQEAAARDGGTVAHWEKLNEN